ncbi:MAG: SDR family NAD(P)-dependent oxidoreductase [Myxococcota bacterium]
MNIETKHLDTVISRHTQDLTGKDVAVTGTTSGTGYVCARELAKLGARVLLLNRTSDRASKALEKLQAEVPNGRFEAVECDLQSFESVRSAAAHVQNRLEALDVLCNNAGVMALADLATADGYDVQMQTNCLSHFLLTRELFPLLKAAPEGRVVNHTSMARLGPNLAPEYFEKRGGDLGGDGTDEENSSFGGPRWARYHQTKLGNCAFTYGMKARLDKAGIKNVKVLLAHPGLAATNLQLTTADAGGMDAESDLMKLAQSAEDGATGIIRACADPEAASGDFFGPERWSGFPDRIEPEALLTDADNLRVNWDGCEAAVGPFYV